MIFSKDAARKRAALLQLSIDRLLELPCILTARGELWFRVGRESCLLYAFERSRKAWQVYSLSRMSSRLDPGLLCTLTGRRLMLPEMSARK